LLNGKEAKNDLPFDTEDLGLAPKTKQSDETVSANISTKKLSSGIIKSKDLLLKDNQVEAKLKDLADQEKKGTSSHLSKKKTSMSSSTRRILDSMAQQLSIGFLDS